MARRSRHCMHGKEEQTLYACMHARRPWHCSHAQETLPCIGAASATARMGKDGHGWADRHGRAKTVMHEQSCAGKTLRHAWAVMQGQRPACRQAGVVAPPWRTTAPCDIFRGVSVFACFVMHTHTWCWSARVPMCVGAFGHAHAHTHTRTCILWQLGMHPRSPTHK